MSLAQITEKIDKDAHAEAEKLLSAAKEKEAEIKREADSSVNEISGASQARFDKERPEIFKRSEIVARLDVAKIELGAKRKLIQDVFDEALVKLEKLGSKEYLGFCEKLLKEAAKDGGELLLVSNGEKYITKEWVDGFNSRNNAKIKLSDKRQDFSGGFVLNNGRIDVNCSWEMLMRAAQEKLEPEVVKRLFPA
ncbi:ATPase [Synergistales bacterium]|nr:ATPase [Synergistales bacterium]